MNGLFYLEENWKKELDKPICTTDAQGTKVWKNKQGQYHREDGPAVEQKNGIKSWWINGKRHREDGPALERPDGTKEWWLNDKFLTKTEWKKELGKPICETDVKGNKR